MKNKMEKEMPLISQFYGILIYIYTEIDGKHNKPHFHAKYSGEEGVYDFEGNLIAGALPVRQQKLVVAWCEIHKDELEAAWIAWNESGEIIKIEGLR